MNSISAFAKTYRVTNSHLLQLKWINKYSSAASEANIKIPNRIPRGPTDILKALESTVSYDLTGPSYKYFDDPFLAPYHDKQGRMYALAKSAGQKAARWVRDQHPELFTQVISEPAVMSYMPPTPINADTADESMLLQKIHSINVTDAMKVYELLQEQKKEVSEDVQVALLELLCFYNCEDPVPMEDPSDRYYGQGKVRMDPSLNSWKNDEKVKSLFENLKHLGSVPYSAMISGMMNYGAKAEGDVLVAEAKEKGIKLEVHAYNAMIIRLISIYDKIDVKRDMLVTLLKEMNEQGVKPNIGTLNAAMDVAGRLNDRSKFEFSMQILKDFTAVGVIPSIGTYGLIIRGLVGRVKPHMSLQSCVSLFLESLKGQRLEMKGLVDSLFFEWCMKACVVLDDLPSAIQCLELFLLGKNRMFLDGMKTNAFYNNFFQVLCSKGDFESIMKYYTLLCPHAHTASPEFYKVIFESCDMNGAIDKIPVFWKQYLSTGAFHEETIMKMLEVSLNLSSLPDPAAIQIRPVLGELAETFVNYKIDSSKQKLFEKVPLTSEMLNLSLILLARGSQWRTIQKGLKHLAETNAYPEDKVVSAIVDSCYDHDNPNMAVWVIEFCQQAFGHHVNLKDVCSQLMKTDFLSDSLKDKLRDVYDESSSSSSSSSESESSDSDDDSSDSGGEMSIPRKEKPPVPKPDITKLYKS